MKIVYSVCLSIAVAAAGLGCTSPRIYFDGIYMKTLTLSEALNEKELIDSTDNPAKKDLIEKNLAKCLIKIDNLKVKDIVLSTDIDYKFCVIAEYQSPKGLIDLYIYSKDNSAIAKLEKKKSVINVFGYFRRFFRLIDNTWIKIDIGDSQISIIDNKE